MIRLLVCLAFVASTLAIGQAQAERSPATPERPNIVIILADDLGYGDCRPYNSDSKIPTPNLDRMAAEGARFDDAHSPSAVCTPTRYTLLTGEYCWRTRLKRGVLNGYSRSLLDGKTTLAEMLSAQGYATACIGKWHLGLGQYDPTQSDRKIDYDQPIDAGPHTEGFAYSYILPASLDMAPYLYVENGVVAERASHQVKASKRRREGGGGFWRKGAIAPSFDFEQVVPTFTSKSVQWLESVADEARPFFLYLPMPAPHTPWMPTKEFQGRSEAGYYGDFVAQLDDSVGQVMAALQRKGVLDKTLIIFTSDNGASWRSTEIERYDHLANGPLRGQKADIHEGGHRVPFLVRWPGQVPAKMQSKALIGLQDIFATIGEIVSADQDQRSGAIDSVSFLAAMRGGQGNRQSLVNHSADGMFAIRRGNWKFIEGRGTGGFTKPKRIKPTDGHSGQLYDLETDLGETQDLFLSRPKRVAELKAVLEQIRGAQQ